MKQWKYRGYRCRFGSAMGFGAMFFAYDKRGERVAKGYFKCDLHDAIDRLCELKTGNESATGAGDPQTADGPLPSTA